jgi:hypothetical protein
MQSHRAVLRAAALALFMTVAGGCKARSNFVTVGAHCQTFCNAFCNRCAPGMPVCIANCQQGCQHGRDPSMVLDGTNPAVALAKTPAEDEACVTAIATADCRMLAMGQPPPICYSWQR